ncbi:hypothetical protein [Vibrio agarivorans]|uniref:Uncharacterized protein n=1 Tax=Vibrio agarivorans TaxID=153622 RepID=A0ABT7Y7K7_9VIBR|nr:hypothetical protein [Vibrio agarivorans]MDN2483976.1 hypothetical protein [Vibrio agarivorans]
MPEVTEQILLDRVKGGDSDASIRFFRRYENLLFWCCSQVSLNDSDSREDLESLAKVGLFESVQSYAPQDSNKFEVHAAETICRKLTKSFGYKGGLVSDTQLDRALKKYRAYADIEVSLSRKPCPDRFIAKEGLKNGTASRFRWLVTLKPNEIESYDCSVLEKSKDPSPVSVESYLIKKRSDEHIVSLIKESLHYLPNQFDKFVGTMLVSSILENRDFNTALIDEYGSMPNSNKLYLSRNRVLKHIREYLEYYSIDGSHI